MPKLHITSPASIARTIELTEKLISIGRTADNDLCLQDHNVSQRHGMLVRDGHDYQLHDFKSTNGTFVDGQRIMAVKLHHGAKIRFGPVEVEYESAPAAAAASQEPSGVKPSEQASLMAPASAGRGMAKRMKPEYAASGLQPGSFAKPIPPVSPKTVDQK